MILYDSRCTDGQRFAAGVASRLAPEPEAPAGGAGTRRVPSRVQIGGVADAGPSREQMPNSWRGIGGGHPDAISHWRSKIEKREKLEEKHPELGGDRRPVLAHEGIFRGQPLRAGDDIPASIRAARAQNAGAGSEARPGKDSGAGSDSTPTATTPPSRMKESA